MTILDYTVAALADHIGGEVVGDGQLKITGAATLSEAVAGQVSFLANAKYIDQVPSCQGSVIIVAQDFDCSAYAKEGLAFICVKDPYYGFMQIVVLLHGHREHREVTISDKTDIDTTAQIGEGVDIHAFVTIGAGAKIGNGTKIYSGCSIGADVIIGDNCILYPNVTIYERCILGDRVTLHASCVIGQDGFGYATHDGKHNKIPQIGAAVIGNDVEMGAGCTVDRATLGNTEIGEGCKFSNAVTVGHNSKLGKGCLIVAQVGIAGSATIGDYCVFGGKAAILGHIKIGSHVKAGANSGVYNDIPDGQTILGIPAQSAMQTKRNWALINKLPEFKKKLRELDEAMRAVEKRQDDKNIDSNK